MLKSRYLLLMDASTYIVPDLLAPQLKLVFCGTAPSRLSAAAKAYYANPQNRFWPTLHAVGLTPHQYTPTAYPKLLEHGIGLTDICKTISGNDDQLPKDHIRKPDLHAKIMRYQPRLLAFTSKTAAQWALEHKVHYGMLEETIGTTKLYVCCSPSPRARRYWDETIWRQLADTVKRL